MRSASSDERLTNRIELLRCQRGQHNRGRIELLRGSRQRLDRSVRAEVGDPPTVLTQSEPEDDQAKLVLLLGSAGEQSTGAGATIPATGKRKQPSTDHDAREVLLGDRSFAPFPAVAELAQVRKNDLAGDGLEAERPDQFVERRLRAGVVEAVERLAELG